MNNKEIEKIELLSPAGDMQCLIAAVQSGADAVYFGANKFNARANSNNFNFDELKIAIEYAKLRNVKTHMTLNILIKNNEFEEAIDLVKTAYEFGIDAIIVQDLGLAKEIRRLFPDLQLHASTQTTTYNVEGVDVMEEIGFDRIVLARELNIDEITDICKNTDKEIEVFVHGALCISYSGQCLMSSIIGGRSGNRGRCAGTCRLPYQMCNLDNGNIIEKGYLLSSKDVCTLDILPQLIESGIKSLKIEGRMKSPEYVSIVTSIYRKYIDLYYSNNEYIVQEEDRKALMQIFNRGGFSTGYLKGKLGKDMMYIKKPNHIGLILGKIVGYNSNKGHINVKLEEDFELGDSISVNDMSCKSSELMINGQNIKSANKGQTVTIGRLKGKIEKGDVIYKTTSSRLLMECNNKISKENIKRPIDIKLKMKCYDNIKIEITDILTGMKHNIISDVKAEKAQKVATTSQRIIEQIKKTGNTVFEVNVVDLDMDDDIFVPIAILNDIRRNALDNLQSKIIDSFKRKYTEYMDKEEFEKVYVQPNRKKVSILLNILNKEYDYNNLKSVDNVYIPFRYWQNMQMQPIIENICKKYNTYIYLPAITKENYLRIFQMNFSTFDLKGIVISNVSQLKLVNRNDSLKGKEIIANYTLNIFNDYTINLLNKYGFDKFTISPELNNKEIEHLNRQMNSEMIVYGRTLLMTSEYCLVGHNSNCEGKCKKGRYALKDRINYVFPVYTDVTNCNSLIYNSKITSIQSKDINIDSIRIDVLDESIDEINKIVYIHSLGQKLEGGEYTNGNFNKEV